jgi:hypothetical protein
MQAIQRSELYTDNGNYVVMTRTAVVKYSQLASIAGHLCRNAEELVSSTNPPTIDNCRIAATMLGWAYHLVPMRIECAFDY